MPAASSRAAARSLVAIVIDTAVNATQRSPSTSCGDPQQQRRIDAARKTDQRRTVAGDGLAQPIVFVGERQIGGSGGGHRHVDHNYTTIRSLAATAAAISAATSSLSSTRWASWARARVAGCDGTNSEQQSSNGRIDVS